MHPIFLKTNPVGQVREVLVDEEEALRSDPNHQPEELGRKSLLGPS
jgi:hypothetical protein